MYLAHLALTNFRTFRRLELDLPPGLHLITSANALGKTNLLEAIAMLATARSVRGGTDADLIAWEALEEDPLPAARLSARVETVDGSTTLEIAVIARDLQAQRPPHSPPDRKVTASRRFRVNGVARRASDLIGRLRVVMFAAEDLRLIDGPPTLRRRYLDITISQFDPAYVRALQRYSRVLQQRNSLLRRLQETDPVLGVALGNPEAENLAPQSFCNGQTGCIVCRPVNPQPTGESLQGTVQRSG